MQRNLTRTITVLTAAYLAAAIAGFGFRRPGYSHLRHTISELGEFGAADSGLVAWGVFLPVGIALAAIAVQFVRGPRGAAAYSAGLLAACVAAGYLVAAFFPCDPGSPLSGSPRQSIHNLGGAVEYIGGAIALAALARASRRFRWVFGAAAVLVLAVAFGVSAPELASGRGLVQRVGETALFGSILLATINAQAKGEVR